MEIDIQAHYISHQFSTLKEELMTMMIYICLISYSLVVLMFIILLGAIFVADFMELILVYIQLLRRMCCLCFWAETHGKLVCSEISHMLLFVSDNINYVYYCTYLKTVACHISNPIKDV